MRRKTASPPADSTDGTSGPKRPRGQAAGGTQPAPTPHRPVVSLSLVLFFPALWLVLNGNLSVQAALLRFIGALLVSWVAAWVVFTTVSSFARSAGPAQAVGATGSSDAAGRTDLSVVAPVLPK